MTGLLDEALISAVRRGSDVMSWADVEHARLGFHAHVLRVGGAVITRASKTYAEAGDGPFMIVGSSGCYEISIAGESAAELLQLGRFDVVTIQP